jgi:hypothetical protein
MKSGGVGWPRSRWIRRSSHAGGADRGTSRSRSCGRAGFLLGLLGESGRTLGRLQRDRQGGRRLGVDRSTAAADGPACVVAGVECAGAGHRRLPRDLHPGGRSPDPAGESGADARPQGSERRCRGLAGADGRRPDLARVVLPVAPAPPADRAGARAAQLVARDGVGRARPARTRL